LSVYLNNFSQVGNKGKWVLLSHPGYTIMEQLLLSLAISDVSQMGYELQGVERIFLPCLDSAQELSAHMCTFLIRPQKQEGSSCSSEEYLLKQLVDLVRRGDCQRVTALILEEKVGPGAARGGVSHCSVGGEFEVGRGSGSPLCSPPS
jgi:hypothetical protein